VVDRGTRLSGVACPSSRQCTAVDAAGRDVTFDPTSPGSPTPHRIDSSLGTNGDVMIAVACPSTRQCTAIDNSVHEVTFDPTSPGTPTPVTIEPGFFTGLSNGYDSGAQPIRRGRVEIRLRG
jgi:hypothetical protein